MLTAPPTALCSLFQARGTISFQYNRFDIAYVLLPSAIDVQIEISTSIKYQFAFKFLLSNKKKLLILYGASTVFINFNEQTVKIFAKTLGWQFDKIISINIYCC